MVKIIFFLPIQYSSNIRLLINFFKFVKHFPQTTDSLRIILFHSNITITILIMIIKIIITIKL